MKRPLSGCLVFLFAYSSCVWAQAGSRAGFSPAFGDSGPPLLPSTGMSFSGSNAAIFVSGKVVLQDGGELSEPVGIRTICRGQRRMAAFSDAHGSFSFQLGDPTAEATAAVSDASANTGSRAMQSWSDSRDCQLEAVLAGFSSQTVELSGRLKQLDSINVGRVTLHRLEHVEGTSISVTSALAPSSARKDLEKARQKEKQGKWDEAVKLLENAVQVYPRYAVAWCELGRVQLRSRQVGAAKHSFEQAMTADGQYVDPYDGLAQVALQARDWRGVIEITDKLLVMNSVDFPDAYFFNAAANYYLKNLDAAERVALQGVRVDEGHQVPKLQFLLAVISMEKHDYLAAEQHIRQYLTMATQPADIEQARKTLAE